MQAQKTYVFINIAIAIVLVMAIHFLLIYIIAFHGASDHLNQLFVLFSRYIAFGIGISYLNTKFNYDESVYELVVNKKEIFIYGLGGGALMSVIMVPLLNFYNFKETVLIAEKVFLNGYAITFLLFISKVVVSPVLEEVFLETLFLENFVILPDLISR